MSHRADRALVIRGIGLIYVDVSCLNRSGKGDQKDAQQG